MPIDAILLANGRATTVPLVAEAADWIEGVLFGATMTSDPVMDLSRRFDPFAMLPFCGYDVGAHWQHWLEIGAALGAAAPRIFRINGFRAASDGHLLWPGRGENIRVLEWIVGRLEHEVDAVPSPVGLLPYRHDLDLTGLDLPDQDVRDLLTVDAARWRAECDAILEFFSRVGSSVPTALTRRVSGLRWRLHDYR